MIRYYRYSYPILDETACLFGIAVSKYFISIVERNMTQLGEKNEVRSREYLQTVADRKDLMYVLIAGRR